MEEQHFQLFHQSANELVEFNKSGNPINVMPWLRHVMPWTVANLLRVMRNAVSVLPTKVKEHEDRFNEMYLNDITDCFLAAKLPDDVVDETYSLSKDGLILPVLNELMLAAQETTSTTLSWLILYMVAYPTVQCRVQMEIDEFVGSGRSVKVDDKLKLPYTEATIYEVLRITSIVPLALPHCAVNDTKFKGFDIDKGTVIIANLHSANLDGNIWRDPGVFNPERLINGKNELATDKCNQILPFGIGMRKCPGEKLAKLMLFLIFSNLMQRFTFEKAANDTVDLSEVPGVISKPKQTKIMITDR